MEVPTTQYELLQLLNITSEFHRDILGEILNGSNSDSKARVE
jgi:hypothetical protein